MGKKLIIKGADFSENGIASIVEGELTIKQGQFSLLSNSDSYGNFSENTDYKTRAGSKPLIYLEAGAKITFSGLSKLGSPSLRIDGCYFDSEDGGHAHIVGDMHGGSTQSTDLFLYNAEGTSDTCTITNTWGSYWFRFAFARGASKDQNITDGITLDYIIK